MDIVGSETVKQILEVIRDVVQKTAPTNTPIDTLPQTERVRLIDRIKLRLGQRLLGLNDFQLSQTLRACGRAGEDQNA